MSRAASALHRVAHLGGPIAWMARNPVAANLLMAVLVVGGLVVGSNVKQEVFPEFTLEWVSVRMAYPGASPEEVEEGIVLAVEEAVRGLDGVKKVIGSAREGMGSVWIELLLTADQDRVVADVKNAVDRIQSFPEDAERPVVAALTNRREVISVAIYGDIDEGVLKELAERFRDNVLTDKDITLAEVTGVRPTEISVEVPQSQLRTHGLTLDGIARAVSRTSVQIPAGSLKTAAGEVLLRTDEKRRTGRDFGEVSVVAGPNGSDITLADIARVEDGFSDVDQFSTFDGQPSAMVKVYRVGDQTPLAVAATVRERLATFESRLPAGVSIAVTQDWSEIYRDRMDLLLDNAAIGFALVLLILGLFLELKLAMWVTLGIPISFAGAIMLMPSMGVSVNMISLFAFIVTLGLVVDDAIVVGENVFEHRMRGLSWMDAAIEGAREVSIPVVFAILTTVAAFSPLFLVPGFAGKLFGVIPSIVVAVLLISLVESLFVLPAHLAHRAEGERRGLLRIGGFFVGALLLPLRPAFWLLDGARKVCSGSLAWWIANPYKVILAASLRWRYATLSVGLLSLLLCAGFIGGGHIDFAFMPKLESDVVIGKAVLPFGSSAARTALVQERMIAAAKATFEELGGEERYGRGIYSQLGTGIAGGGPVQMVSDEPGGHLTTVQVRLVEGGLRDFSASDFADRWRQAFGTSAGIDVLTFSGRMIGGAGAAIDVQLRHRDRRVLERAADEVAGQLASFAGVIDIDNGFAAGKPQLDLRLKPEARALGLSAVDLGRQTRASFFGSEAIRQMRGRDEVRTYVRLPREDRTSEHAIEELLVRTPAGIEVPLGLAAEVVRGRAATTITRTDGSRSVSVTADVAAGTNAGKVLAELTKTFLPALVERHAGLSYSFEGEQAAQADAMKSLGSGFAVALIVIFGLLAVPFRSYIQPLVVMAAIPFGILGAVLGHVLMGYELSVISMMGIVALSGVVVNDSLVLVVAANRFREDGHRPLQAIVLASMRRFRPILLTSLTTFFGLLPMIFETSVQARFLIPMAISLGYGVLFVTFIVLGMVPSLYLIVEDVRRLVGLGDHHIEDLVEDGDEPPPGDGEDTEPELAPA